MEPQTLASEATKPQASEDLLRLPGGRLGVSARRTRLVISREILAFMAEHKVRWVALSGAIIGCPHEEGVDYEDGLCPACTVWRGRDRFKGRRLT